MQVGYVEFGVGKVLAGRGRGGGGPGFRRRWRRFAAAAEQAQAEQGREERAHGNPDQGRPAEDTVFTGAASAASPWRDARADPGCRRRPLQQRALLDRERGGEGKG